MNTDNNELPQSGGSADLVEFEETLPETPQVEAAPEAALVIPPLYDIPEEVEEAEEPNEPKTETPLKLHHVKIEYPCVRPWPAGKELTKYNSLAMPTAGKAELESIKERVRSLEIANTPKNQMWAESIGEGTSALMPWEMYDETVSNENADWGQDVEQEGERIAAGRPRFGESTDNRLAGEAAVLRIQSILGLGSVVKIPLWHTGIWVSIKAPTDAALLELDTRLMDDKTTLGRDTNGLVFSNSEVYITSTVVNFALNHVYEATVADKTVQNLKSTILVTDIPQLLWGLALAIYPNGFPARFPCTSNVNECHHVVEELLNIGKLNWVNRRALTERQRSHMVKRNGVFTKDQIRAYQADHAYVQDQTVKIKDKISVVLKVPTVEEHEESGYRWIESITNAADNAFDVPLRGDQRTQFLKHQTHMTALRRYGHWIAKISVTKTNEVVEDQQTIESLLNVFTGDEDIFGDVIINIGKFIDRCTISLIAIPKYTCPVCEGEQGRSALEHLIPLEVSHVFFTLYRQRVLRLIYASS